ncbi:hypothetical protein ACT0SC_004981, partial [Escherichia coli]
VNGKIRSKGVATMTGNIHDKYEGLCLAPDSFANNIHDLLCAVVVLQMSDNDAIKRTGDEVLEFARCYAEAAAEKELSS